MNLKNIGGLNTERFLTEAFDPICRKKLLRAARIHRNVYLVLFLIGFVCIFVAGFSERLMLTIFSLGVATLSLVVMTKYDTQIFFLKIIEEKGSAADEAQEF